MIVLDTDHISEYQRGSQAGERLRDRLDRADDREIVTTIITVEEQIRGRLAPLKQKRTVHEEVPAYQQLALLVKFYADWRVLDFDSRAAQEFEVLRGKVRRKTMDLKIAAIVVANGAILLSANLRDFRDIPGLMVKDWLRNRP